MSVCVCVMQGDVWICMELLESSMDKISDRVHQQMKSTIPEDILGKMTVSVSTTDTPARTAHVDTWLHLICWGYESH